MNYNERIAKIPTSWLRRKSLHVRSRGRPRLHLAGNFKACRFKSLKREALLATHLQIICLIITLITRANNFLSSSFPAPSRNGVNYSNIITLLHTY